jgi:GNAT superfamily N-acetyltransferase
MSSFEETFTDVRDGKNLRYMSGSAALPGLYTLEVYHEGMPVPLALIWYKWSGGFILDISHMYTQERFRRIGLATKLFAWLRQQEAAYIITGVGNEFSGPWLTKMGFEKIIDGHGWIFQNHKTKAKELV